MDYVGLTENICELPIEGYCLLGYGIRCKWRQGHQRQKMDRQGCSIQSQMSAKKLERALVRQGGRLGFKVLALVAIESVAGIVDE